MAVDWAKKETPAIVSPRPPIDEEITLLSTFEFVALEGPQQYETLQITRAFRSWSPNHDGDHFVHIWAEDDGLGFVADIPSEDAPVVWLQYTLDAKSARLPLYDERGTSRSENPEGRLKNNPLGTNPAVPLLSIVPAAVKPETILSSHGVRAPATPPGPTPTSGNQELPLDDLSL